MYVDKSSDWINKSADHYICREKLRLIKGMLRNIYVEIIQTDKKVLINMYVGKISDLEKKHDHYVCNEKSD